MRASPRLSAAICTVNRPESIASAVGSVLANEHPSFELLVVDQTRDDTTERALDEFRGDPRLRYVRLDRVGLSAAYNAAIARTVAPTLAFTDDDCVAPPDWLEEIERAFAAHSDAEMLYGQTLAPPELQGASGVVPVAAFTEERKIGKGHDFLVGGMGANFAIRRSLPDRIGGFDEALGGGGPLQSSQDFDYLYRAYKDGAISLMTPRVRVTHYGLRTLEQWPATMRAYGIGDGAFYLKHVRCGDLFALRLLLFRIARMMGRELRNTVRRRRTDWTYLRSYFSGMRMSLSYPVDRQRRLYRLAPKDRGGLPA